MTSLSANTKSQARTGSSDELSVKLASLPRYTIIELPCLLKSRKAPTTTADGEKFKSFSASDTRFLQFFNMNLKLFSDLLQDKAPPLTFEFPSPNPAKYPLSSTTLPSHGFVARVVRKKSKRSGESRVFVEITGHVRRLIRFNNPADYQYLPMSTNLKFYKQMYQASVASEESSTDSSSASPFPFFLTQNIEVLPQSISRIDYEKRIPQYQQYLRVPRNRAFRNEDPSKATAVGSTTPGQTLEQSKQKLHEIRGQSELVEDDDDDEEEEEEELLKKKQAQIEALAASGISQARKASSMLTSGITSHLNRIRNPHLLSTSSSAHFIRFGEPIPTGHPQGKYPQRISQNVRGSYKKVRRMIDRLQEIFSLVPVLTRSQLISVFGMKKYFYSLKECLPFVAYSYSNGPYLFLWIRYGYDPTKDIRGRFYQSIRLKFSSKYLKLLYHKFLAIIPHTNLNRTFDLTDFKLKDVPLDQAHVFINKGADARLPFSIFGSMIKNQSSFQVYRAQDPELFNFIRHMKVLRECNEVSGWYDPVSTDAFRRIMTTCIDKKIESFIEANMHTPFDFSSLRADSTADDRVKKRRRESDIAPTNSGGSAGFGTTSDFKDDFGLDDFDDFEMLTQAEEDEILNQKISQLRTLMELDDPSILQFNSIEEFSAHYSSVHSCPPPFTLVDNEFFYLKKLLSLSDDEILFSDVNSADIQPRNPLSRLFHEQQASGGSFTSPSGSQTTSIESAALAAVVAATSNSLFPSLPVTLEPHTTVNKRDYFYRIEKAMRESRKEMQARMEQEDEDLMAVESDVPDTGSSSKPKSKITLDYIDEDEEEDEEDDEEALLSATRAPADELEDSGALASSVFGSDAALLELKNIKSFSFFDEDSDSDNDGY